MERIKYETKKLINLIESEIEINKIDPSQCLISDNYSDRHSSAIDICITGKSVYTAFKVSDTSKVEDPITVDRFLKVLKVASEFSDEIYISFDYSNDKSTDLITGISFEKNIDVQDYIVGSEDYDEEEEANRVNWYMLIFH